MADTPKLMAQKAWEAMQHAYSPYSKYKVGACVEAEDGELFTGCNVENASYSLTKCAEANAITTMIAAGKKHIKSLAVIGSGKELCTPCGACRQIIREFATPNTPIYLCDSQTKQVVQTTTLEQLLPQSFGPDHLGE